MTKVLLLAPVDDVHANVVADQIGTRARVGYIDLGAAIDGRLEIVPERHVSLNGAVVAEAGTTVWWRRSGYIEPDSRTGNAENRMRAEETRAQLVGGLLSLHVRWIDHPGVIETAEHTLLQLAAANRCGAMTPATTVTNVPDVARRFAREHRLVAKSISSGVGIAPFADDVDDEVINLLPNAPTLLQEHVPGVADLRIVVVGDRGFVWRRAKQPQEAFDWRRPDPSGKGFEFIEESSVAVLAVAITHRLGLTFSAQDWVETPSGPVFLEANPVGQWLFLNGADEIVGAALADHILAVGMHG